MSRARTSFVWSNNVSGASIKDTERGLAFSPYAEYLVMDNDYQPIAQLIEVDHDTSEVFTWSFYD